MSENVGGLPSQTPARAPSSSRGPLSLILLISAAFFVFFIVAAIIVFKMTAGSYMDDDSDVAIMGSNKEYVGVVELNGVIFNSKKVLKHLDHFAKKKSVKAVVLRVDSPGGAVAPSQEIYEAVQAYKKPIFVSMGSVAASGGYYIAMGAQKGRVFANPGTITGSIGVIMEFANLKDLYEWAKIKRYSITSGKNKDIGAEYKDMSEEQRALLQSMIGDVWEQFITAVAKGRQMDLEKVKPLADGRIYSGAQAMKNGLVDGLEPLQKVVKLAGVEGGIVDDEVEVIYPYKRRKYMFERLLGPSDGEEDEEEEGPWGSKQGGQNHILAEIRRLIVGSDQQATGSAVILSPGLYMIWDGARF